MDNQTGAAQTIGSRIRDIHQSVVGEANAMCDKAQEAITASDRGRTDHILVELFRYHQPRPDQLLKYAAVRSAAKHFAEVMMQNTPYCADQQAALRKIREAVMTANAAIALDGLSL